MSRSILKRFVDVEKDDSLITRKRLERIALFKKLISNIQKPLKILDVGGTPLFWEKMGFADNEDYEIIVLNLSKGVSSHANIKTVAGDATDLNEYSDNEFDVVFSNSVIEHVGGYEEQIMMAKEVRRVGKRYFLQTPNYLFPFEPHFLCPCFQFFPLWLKVLMVRNFNLGWRRKTSDKQKATEIAKSVRLLRRRELEELFPDGTVYNDKLFSMIYSFLVYCEEDFQ